MKMKRFAALFMAATILFTNYAFDLPARAAETSDTDIVLTYTDSDEEDPKSATIVSGGNTTIKIEKTSGNSPVNDKPFIIKDSDSNDVTDTRKIVIDPITGARQQYMVKADENLDPNNGEQTFNITGNYYTMTKIGSAYETYSTGTGQYVNLTSEKEQAVMEYSTITIKCDKAESSGVNPHFIISEEGTGIFKGYTGVSVESCTQDSNTTQQALKDKRIRIQLIGGSDVVPNFFVFEPKQTHILTNGKPEGNPDYQELSRNNYIEENSTYTFTYRPPTSNTLYLTVLTPNKAKEKVRDEIQLNDGVSENKKNYIELANGDTLTDLRSDFFLRTSVKKFSSNFEIKWDWEPDKEENEDAIYIPTTNEKPNWCNVRVTRKPDNVAGTLTASVYFKKDGTAVDNNPVFTGKINILIYGSGTPAVVTQYSQNIGQGDEIKFGDKDKKLPNTVKMNVYNGIPKIDGKDPVDPWKYNLKLEMGNRNASSLYAKILIKGDSGDASAIRVVDQTTSLEYKNGDQIANPDVQFAERTGVVNLNITAQNSGNVVLTIEFYIKGRNNQPELASSYTTKITVIDTSPSDNAFLKDRDSDETDRSKDGLVLKDQDNVVYDFGYSSQKLEYRDDDTVRLPYSVEHITFKATKAHSAAEKVITYSYSYWDGSSHETELGGGSNIPVNSGTTSDPIELKENIITRLEITVTAENQTKKTYLLDMMREPPSEDSTLKTLKMSDEEENFYLNYEEQKLVDLEYTITVPFSVDQLYVEAETNHRSAEIVSINPPLKQKFLSYFGLGDKKQWIELNEDKYTDTIVEITVISERDIVEKNDPPKDQRVYKITVKREKPSTISTLENIKVTDGSIEAKELTMNPKFNKNLDVEDQPYEVNVPYTTDKIRVIVTPTDKKATMELYETDEKGEIVGGAIAILAADVPSKKIAVPFTEGTGPDLFGFLWINAKAEEVTTETDETTTTPESSDPEGSSTPDESSTPSTDDSSDTSDSSSDDNSSSSSQPEEEQPVVDGYRLCVLVTPEDPNAPKTKYLLNIVRQAPSKDTGLSSVAIAGFEAGADKTGAGTPVEFEFLSDVYSYNIKIPYEYERIKITPTASDANSTIKMGIRTIQSGQASPTISIPYPGTETVTLTVTAQDKTKTQDYTFNISRQKPSNDARLKALEVGNASKIKPVFIASTTKYTSTVNENAEGVTITATTNSDKATLTIDGKVAKSGVASELITLLEVKQEVEIVVTAQDRTTTKTYTVRFTNENLINKTSNADLASLVVKDGVMKPKFSPSATEYEVSVKEETSSIEIIPETADPMAQMKVFSGTKEIGDDEGNYVSALVDGANEFSVEVTAPDKSKTKKYVITVYRNDEEHQGTLKPVKVEDLDFEYSDVITIDINKYPRIGADVFNELKKYPDTQLILQGNDYSLQFSGADVTTTVPFEEVFDFGLSFTSPNKDIIEDEIYSHRGNNTLEYVIVHFDHHGALPAPATFNLSLGRRYADETLYWHYYNEERDRIDYYGKFTTNSRGTFAVTLDHLSDYIVADRRIVGSEWKDGGEVASELEEIQISQDAEEKRINPNTGAEEGGQAE